MSYILNLNQTKQSDWGLIKITNKIKYFRQELGITQKQLGTVASISERHLRRVENDFIEVTYTQMLRISKALNQSIEEVFDLELVEP